MASAMDRLIQRTDLWQVLRGLLFCARAFDIAVVAADFQRRYRQLIA
jgi:hypothetical protein